MTKQETEQYKCPDCGVQEGQIHKDNCDQEICSFCGEQYWFCLCEEEGNKRLIRIPFVATFDGWVCGICGEISPDEFCAEDWFYVVPPPLSHDILCYKCYEHLKQIFPKGWETVNP